MKKFKIGIEYEQIIEAKNVDEALEKFWNDLTTWALADIEEIEENN